MNKKTARSYLEVVEKSGLVPPETLHEVLEALSDVAHVHDADGPLAQLLLERDLITPWHQEKLARGQFKGFFLGHYKLLSHIATGGMSRIYLAEHVPLARRVALKVLPPALSENPPYLARFLQEARTTAALDHPNVVCAYDVGHEGKFYFLVTEFLEGDSLEELVERDGPQSPDRAADFIRQAAEGLQHVHDHEIIHRDIKPGNLILDKHGVIKIVDLGLVRLLEQLDEQSLTLANHEQVIGTVDYLAPEQLVDSHNVSPRADLYSLGCTMFYLLSGQPPFSGKMAERLMKHQAEQPPDVTAQRPEVPASLAAICRKLMVKRPSERYASARELADALEKWLAEREAESSSGTAARSLSQAEEPSVDDAASATVVASEEEDNTAAAMVSQLLEQGVLTRYQADILSGQSNEPLVVDSYQMLEKIETGRLAGCYRARHKKYQFPVCLRLMLPQGTEEECVTQAARFQREARIASQADHPHVLRTYDVGQSGGRYFMSFESLEGRTLQEWLDAEGPLEIATACALFRDAAMALAHLHEQGIVHRHVMPANLWITIDGRLKLIDFSLARDTLVFLDDPHAERKPERREKFVGAPGYLAPEEALDEARGTPQSDLYSLGCSLYHALCGHVPFESRNSVKQMLLHASRTPPVPSDSNDAIPKELDALILRLLAKQPEKRFPHAEEVAQALEKFCE